MKNARREQHQGRVLALLPHALLLETEASTEQFLAPLRQLAPEVLQAVAAGESPSVSFQVQWQPGAWEAEGFLRAFGVTPADSPAGGSSTGPRRLAHSAEDLPPLEENLEDLDSLSEGLAAARGDPNLMEEVFARCIAALTAPQNRRGGTGLRLLRLLRRCLRSLLLSGPRTVRRLRPQLLHCRAALATSGGSRMMAWTARVGRLVARGLVAAVRHRRPRGCHRRDVKCNVKGCQSAGHGRVKEPDLLGLAGVRCCLHGARRCTVRGCTRFARGSVEMEDQWGPAGRRCQTHIPTRSRWCNVPGCGRFPRGLVDASDALGPAGYRCAFHGCGCCVVGCRKTPWGRVSSADVFGPPGRRCWIHGGQCCDVPGCGRTPRRRVATADQYGPPGVRCDLHSLKPRRRIEGRCVRWRVWCGNKLLWRCGKASIEGSKYCEDHGPKCRYRSTAASRPCSRQRSSSSIYCEQHHGILCEQRRRQRYQGRKACEFPACSQPARRRIVMADGTPSLRCIAHRESVPSVPSVASVASLPSLPSVASVPSVSMMKSTSSPA
mmetsp:Transcript_74409/g.164329  ORF Transcript_74409/g.164329 Transcript_74409/m.164329 type:complete len:550 (+) Transcript_74409:45-1694(+)